jgi:hypothetical protein
MQMSRVLGVSVLVAAVGLAAWTQVWGAQSAPAPQAGGQAERHPDGTGTWKELINVHEHGVGLRLLTTSDGVSSSAGSVQFRVEAIDPQCIGVIDPRAPVTAKIWVNDQGPIVFAPDGDGILSAKVPKAFLAGLAWVDSFRVVAYDALGDELFGGLAPGSGGFEGAIPPEWVH